jgi:hypothetical protein
VPNSIVLGDYVIEYGDDEAGDDYEVLHRVRGNWWTSCIFCKSFGSSRGRRRARTRERRGSESRGVSRSTQERFALEVPARSVGIREIRFGGVDDEYLVTGASRRMASHYRSAHILCSPCRWLVAKRFTRFGRYRVLTFYSQA